MHMFAEFIDECHLLDLESYGLPYTWFNKRSDSSSIFEKLDRVLISYNGFILLEMKELKSCLLLGSIM